MHKLVLDKIINEVLQTSKNGFYYQTLTIGDEFYNFMNNSTPYNLSFIHGSTKVKDLNKEENITTNISYIYYYLDELIKN